MVKLSICIAVYNQIEIVKKNIDNLIQYKGNDIEIIISDDCSTDKIEELVKSYQDKRLRYVRTPFNGGHDLNILNAIRSANGDYVIVLRSRDTLIPDKVESIISELTKHENVAYAVFSAIDENGKPKVSLSTKIYKEGFEAIRADKILFVHPSGNIYKTSLLNIDGLVTTINESFDHKFGFTVHELIRMELACKGDSFTSAEVAWIYQNSAKQKDIAVNSIGQGKSVYNPELGYERYSCELTFVNTTLKEKEKYIYCLNKNIIRKFFKRISYDFIAINKDKELQAHYNYKEIDFSFSDEKHRFIDYTNGLLEQLSVKNRKSLRFALYRYALLLSIYYPIRDTIINKLFSRDFKTRISRIVKRM